MKTNKSIFHTKLFFKIVLFSFFLITSCNSLENKNTMVDNLTCEYLENPLGVDVQRPRFSWNIASDERGVSQSAYQIIVGDNLNDVKKGTGNIWDSGKITSDAMVNIEYEGAPLQSNKKYYWGVGVWTDNDNEVWSDPASFHTGFFSESDWKAEWITPKDTVTVASPLLRKEFSVDKKVEEAYAFVTAGGFYELYINGTKVGDQLMDPAITEYSQTVLYSTFDVTELLNSGENVVGAMLGNGAYNAIGGEGRYAWGRGGGGTPPCLLAQINITYTDGTQSVLISDDTWKSALGPITFNNLFGGEDYDARMEIDGWDTAEFDDQNWENVVIATEPGGKLKSQMMPPVKVRETIQPVASTNDSSGVYLYDLGQNIPGNWKITVKGEPGVTVRVSAAETLNDSLWPKPLEVGDILSTNARYHSGVWTDYTLKSSEAETYEPRFFYTGYRYIKVKTSNNENLDEIEVVGRVINSSLERNGTFTSSEPLLNQTHEAGLWSQIGNTVFYPTDCPQREKGAYLGDGQVIAETSMHDFNMAAFYTKWVNDMRDSQQDNGRIPNTTPTLVGGMGGGIPWGSAYILIPWWMHEYYGDTRILEEHYPTQKEYLYYLKELAKTDSNPEEDYVINDFGSYWTSLGEWCAPEQRDGPNHPVVSTYYYYYNTVLMEQIAEVLGKTEDAREFAALADTIKNAFNDTFFDEETGFYGTEEAYQTYQVLALNGDIIPDGYREKVVNTVVDDVIARDNHLNTGILGTKYLWPSLSQEGYDDLAFEVATQTTFPSFGFWLENNSTTLIEHWNGGGSHNHEMFGSIVEYYYKYLAGIQSPMEGNTSVAYKYIYLEPRVPEGLNSVDASYETVQGEVSVSWEKSANAFKYEVSIPANTTASVILPAFDFQNITITEGDTEIWANGSFIQGDSGIEDVKNNSGSFEVSIGSGSYVFNVQAN